MALADIGTTGSVILSPLVTLWNSFVGLLPGLLAAILVLILGYCVAYLIGHALKLLLERIGLNKAVERSLLAKAIGHTNIGAVVGEVTKWYIFIVFLQVAVDLLQLGTLSSLLNTFVLWLPNVIAAVLILFVGIGLAHYVEIKLREYTNMRGMKTGGAIVKVVILFLAIIIALEQIGIEMGILENTFLILVGALGLGIALALGIGLGLGLRDTSKKAIEDLKRNF